MSWVAACPHGIPAQWRPSPGEDTQVVNSHAPLWSSSLSPYLPVISSIMCSIVRALHVNSIIHRHKVFRRKCQIQPCRVRNRHYGFIYYSIIAVEEKSTDVLPRHSYGMDCSQKIYLLSSHCTKREAKYSCEAIPLPPFICEVSCWARVIKFSFEFRDVLASKVHLEKTRVAFVSSVCI